MSLGAYNNIVVAFFTDSDLVNTSNGLQISAVNLTPSTNAMHYIRRDTEIEKTYIEQFMVLPALQNGLLTGQASSTSAITVNYRTNIKLFKTPSFMTADFTAITTPAVVYQNISAGTVSTSPTNSTIGTITYNEGYIAIPFTAISGSPLVQYNNYAVTALQTGPWQIVADCYV
jgi:hypothetical protein